MTFKKNSSGSVWVGGARKESDATVGPQVPAQQQEQRLEGQLADEGAIGPALGGQQVCKDALHVNHSLTLPSAPQALQGWQTATVAPHPTSRNLCPNPTSQRDIRLLHRDTMPTCQVPTQTHLN